MQIEEPRVTCQRLVSSLSMAKVQGIVLVQSTLCHPANLPLQKRGKCAQAMFALTHDAWELLAVEALY